MIEKKVNINSLLNPYGQIVLELKDQKGNLKKIETINMRSFVKQFWDLVYKGISGTGSGGFSQLNIDGGSSFNRCYGGKSLSGLGNAGADYRGIFVGTGTDPVALDDSDLQTRITHGISTGQLEYGNVTYTELDEGLTGELKRTLVNNSGGQIDITEVGLTTNEEGDYGPILMARDVLDSAFSVPSGNGVTITYQFGFTDGTRNIKTWTSLLVSPANRTFYHLTGTRSIDYMEIYRYDTLWESGDLDRIGVTLGTGDTPFSINDLDLDSVILEGNNSGELSKQAQIASNNISVPNGTYQIIIEGEFINNTASDVVVKEIGYFTRDSLSNIFLINRFVLNSPATIFSGTSRPAKIIINYSL